MENGKLTLTYKYFCTVMCNMETSSNDIASRLSEIILTVDDGRLFFFFFAF
jgi:hypothetical protein